jgi:hypothetical protein
MIYQERIIIIDKALIYLKNSMKKHQKNEKHPEINEMKAKNRKN